MSNTEPFRWRIQRERGGVRGGGGGGGRGPPYWPTGRSTPAVSPPRRSLPVHSVRSRVSGDVIAAADSHLRATPRFVSRPPLARASLASSVVPRAIAAKQLYPRVCRSRTPTEALVRIRRRLWTCERWRLSRRYYTAVDITAGCWCWHHVARAIKERRC